jgi:hypothetical protein
MNPTSLPGISFDQKQYTPAQLFDLFGQIEALFPAALKAAAGDATLRQVTRNFSTARTMVGKCLGRPTSSPSTEAIQAADEERDNLWMGLNAEIEAKLRLRDPNRRAAAERLNRLIAEQFDRQLHRLSLEENTAALERFFTALDASKESQGDLALLGLAIDWYMPLKQAHQAFVQAVAAARLSAASQEELVQTRIACARVSRKLRLLIDLCEDHAEEGHEAYIQLHAQIETVIGAVRSKAQAGETRARQKKAKKPAEDGLVS